MRHLADNGDGMKAASLTRCLAALASVVAPALAPVHAQSADDAITVTAARTTGLEALGGTVVDARAVAALAPVTALDALDRVAGVRAFQTAGPVGGSFVSVRGGEPNFTLVLLDGVKLNDSTNAQGGGFDFAQIDPALIERIEVYRGALSAVHGSDALAGVVNIRLREPKSGETHETVRVLGSSAGEAGGDASIALGWQGGGVLLGAGAYDSGSLDPNGHTGREQGLGRVIGTLRGIRLDGLGLYAATDRRGFTEGSGGARLAVNREQERKSTGLGLLSFEATAAAPAALVPTLRASWSRQDVDDNTPAIAPGVLSGVPAIRAVSAFERWEADFDLRWTQGPLTLAGGGGYRDEVGRGRGFVDFGGGFQLPADFRLRRNVASGFVEATLKPLAWAELTGSARYDAPNTSRARWTGRLAGRVTPVAGGPALFADYSEGFKLPSIYALAYPLIANPLLKPELARSAEAGLEWTTHGIHVRAAAFATRYQDLIDFDPVNFTNVNRSRVDSRGVDAELSVPLGHTLAAEGSLTYDDVTNFSGPPLRTRPDWRGAARLTWTPAPRASAFADVDSTAGSFDQSVPTGQIFVRGHSEASVGAGYQLTKAFALDVVVRNLADRRYEDAVGFPAPGRTVRFSLRLTR